MRDEHVRERATRKGQTGEFNVDPEWATEAAFDPNRKLGDSGSQTGASVKVIGWSTQAGRHLRVLLVPKWKAGEPATGAWWGASAYAARERDVRWYREERDGNPRHAPT